MLDVKRIPPEVGWYLAGFADGEGRFEVALRPRKDGTRPREASLRFAISFGEKEMLTQFKRYLDCGSLKRGEDGIWRFEVNNLNAIRDNVIPFFTKFRFRSAKMRRDFSKFKQITSIIAEGRHLQEGGIEEVLSLGSEMSGGEERKRGEGEILDRDKV